MYNRLKLVEEQIRASLKQMVEVVGSFETDRTGCVACVVWSETREGLATAKPMIHELFPINGRTIPAGKEPKWKSFSVEKYQRTVSHVCHRASSQSKNPEKNQFSGAIVFFCVDLGLWFAISISGFTPDTDEIVAFEAGHVTYLIDSHEGAMIIGAAQLDYKRIHEFRRLFQDFIRGSIQEVVTH